MNTDEMRRLIVMTAYNEVLAGSHYLMGGDGGIPVPKGGSSGGLKNRDIELLDVRAEDSIAVETAKYSKYLCHGRLSRVGGRYGKFAKKSDLYPYLNQCCPELQNHSHLTPRSFDWTTVMLGESCKHKRHFDCIFFVNWVIATALRKSVPPTYNITQWATGVGPVEVLDFDKKKPPSPSKIKDADIFVNVNSSPKHIGFFAAGGLTIHASGADRGVICGDWEVSKYSGIVRLKDSYLKFG